MDNDINALKDAERQQEQPQGAQEQRAQRQRDSNWIVGGVLILLGILFLIGNYSTSFQLQNWWAIFILIPALSNLGTAWNAYRAEGYLSHRGRNALTWGLVTLAVAIIFLLNLDWGIVWPVFLIIIGLSSLASIFSRSNPA